MTATDHWSFRVHEERLAIARLAPDAAAPPWALGGFVTVSRTRDELSIVCAQRHVPPEIVQTRDKVALGIAGVVPMTTVGLLSRLCGSLAAANVPVFVISTHDTDWLLVSADRFESARAALESSGHAVEGQCPAE
jgi:hypothetical protein